MEKRSYITGSCKMIEILSYLLIVASVVVCAYIIKHTDGPIPTHYGFNGEVDGYGPATMLLTLPGSILFTNLIVSLCLHLIKPEHWNMPFKINPGREVIVFHDMALMMVVLELLLSLWTLLTTIDWGMGKGDHILLLSIILTVSVFVVIFGFIIIAARHNKQ